MAIFRKAPARRAFSGIQGSAFATTVGIVPRRKSIASREQLVRVHFCFDQQEGEQKPPRCNCKQRVFKERAYELVDAKQADFLLVPNPKTSTLAKFHRAIVARRCVVLGEPLLPPAKPDAWALRRDAKHLQNKTEILNRARAVLQNAFGKKIIAPADLYVSDADLELTFENEPRCVGFLNKFASHKKLHAAMSKVILSWWENILGYRRLSMAAGQFLEQAHHGAGAFVQGGDTNHTAAMSDAQENETGRVGAANFVKREFNGGVIGSSGASPDSFEQTDFFETDYCSPKC
jgi:hypothetical protein